MIAALSIFLHRLFNNFVINWRITRRPRIPPARFLTSLIKNYPLFDRIQRREVALLAPGHALPDPRAPRAPRAGGAYFDPALNPNQIGRF